MFDKEYTDIVRTFIEMRYELMTYIYTTFWQYASKGTPMVRSLNLIAQDDPESYFREEEFMLGDNLMVVPVSEAGSKKRKAYLPEGNWYNYWTDEKHEGKAEVEVETPLDQIPLFVKAGAVIPFQPKMQYTDEFEFDELTLHIYADDDENTSTLYEDAGDGLEYKNGEQSVKKIITIKSLSAYIIRQEVAGNFETVYKSYKAVFHGFGLKPKMVMVDGNDMTGQVEISTSTYSVLLPKNFKEVLIS